MNESKALREGVTARSKLGGEWTGKGWQETGKERVESRVKEERRQGRE